MKKTFGLLVAAVAVSAAAYETPTMGWSSWNTYRVNISDELIRRQADAMVATGLRDAGYSHINIDDGWFGGRDGNGRHTCNPKRFPKGLAPVVDHIHARGLKAGIYSDAGENTCGSIWDDDALGVGVGFAGHDDADAAFFFRELGFDFIKIDFCGGKGGAFGPRGRSGNVGRTNMCARTRYTAIRKAIDRAGRQDVRMNVCRWAYPGTWVGDVGFSWRTTADIQPNWPSVKSIILENIFLGAYGGRGHYNDMDMLEVGRGMGAEEDRTHFAMWCMLCSPLLIGCDLTKIDAATLRLLKNRDLIALNQDPLAAGAKFLRLKDGVLAMVRDLGTLGGTERAVSVTNLGDAKTPFAVDLQEIDLQGAKAVRELVEGEDLPAAERLEGTLVPHATRIYRIRAERRLERAFHPVAWAWFAHYSEIDDAGIRPDYVLCGACGSVTSAGLGGEAGNDAEWRDVWSADGGNYAIEFVTEPPGSPYGFSVLVNGGKAGYVQQSNGWTCDIRLPKGFSTIRISNPADKFMPLRGFRLRRKR